MAAEAASHVRASVPEVSVRAIEAMGDASRRAILERLATQGPASVQEIADAMPISRPAVSRHLRVLREAHLVDEQRHGTRHVFELRADGVQAVQTYIAQLWHDAAARYRIAAENTAPREGRT